MIIKRIKCYYSNIVQVVFKAFYFRPLESGNIIKAMLLLTLASCTTGLAVSLPEETGRVEAFFCDKENCTQKLFSIAENASSIKCALYHINSDFYEKLRQLSATIVTDEKHPMPGAIIESGNGLMHNKFCVIDNKVWTGSWNPAQEMSIANNAVVVESKTLAMAYLAEFEEMQNGLFHGGKNAPGITRLNDRLAEAYFCPEDGCKKQVIKLLKESKTTIHFMSYSFTDDDIGNLLVELAGKGIDVKGVFDPRMNSYSEYEKLKKFSIIRKNHHKVFIIDGRIVITGSYNPTRNANEENDENILILREPEITAEFEKEFKTLFD